MADTKISALTAATTPLAGTEVLPIVQSGVTKQVSVANLTAGRLISTSEILVNTAATLGNSAVSVERGSLFLQGDGVAIKDGTNAFLGGYFVSFLDAANNKIGRIVRSALSGISLYVGNGGGIDYSANTPAAGMTSQLLNWYEEGTWTPVLTFQTPGDLSVSYSAQVGTYTRIGNRVILQCFLQTSAFTFTTASGYLQITGIPFAGNSSTGRQNYGAGQFGGITKAGYTDFVASVENGLPNAVLVYCSGSAVTPDFVSAANTPTGGTMTIKFTLTYQV